VDAVGGVGVDGVLAPLPDQLAALEGSIADRQGAVVDEQLVQGVGAPDIDAPGGFDHQAGQLQVVGVGDLCLMQVGCGRVHGCS
jgi:hypothetical protein